MDNKRIINYKRKLKKLRERLSVLNQELIDLEIEKRDYLDKCNHELILVYENDERLVGPVKVGYCLICDEIGSIPWNENYLKSINFDFDSVIDVSDILEDYDYSGLIDFEIRNLKKQRTDEIIKYAKVMFHEYLYVGVTDREEIKKGIKEEIIRLNNNVKEKKLK